MQDIDNPSHYLERGGIEPRDFIESNNFGKTEGDVIKLITRYPFKEMPYRDLLKALNCIQYLIEHLDEKMDFYLTPWENQDFEKWMEHGRPLPKICSVVPIKKEDK